jgi:ubiquinone/menaquinone biosynthesis C-methylase UbiE
MDVSNSEKSDWLEKVFTAKDPDELSDIYNNWAEQYDEDVTHYGYSYKSPPVIAGFVGRHVSEKNGAILDAGAGTGLIGEMLALIGYSKLVALDLSPGMLQVARKKNVYSDLRQMVLGEYLDFPDNTFDATVCAGTFTLGHAPPQSLDEITRITKPGGFIIFSIRCDGNNGDDFISMQESLEKEGKWKLAEKTEPFQSLPFAEPEAENQVFVYKVS